MGYLQNWELLLSTFGLMGSQDPHPGGGRWFSVQGPSWKNWQEVPRVPTQDKGRQRSIGGIRVREAIVFTNVSELWARHPEHGVVRRLNEESEKFDPREQIVVVNSGQIVCAGPVDSCAGVTSPSSKYADLRGGAISPGPTSFGSRSGLREIEEGALTGPGKPYDILLKDVPGIVGDIGGMGRAWGHSGLPAREHFIRV